MSFRMQIGLSSFPPPISTNNNTPSEINVHTISNVQKFLLTTVGLVSTLRQKFAKFAACRLRTAKFTSITIS